MENVLKAQTLVLDLTVIYMEVMKMPAMMMFAARGMEGKVQCRMQKCITTQDCTISFLVLYPENGLIKATIMQLRLPAMIKLGVACEVVRSYVVMCFD